ncbi:MAG: hypothetical protein U0401_27855 [Anaerolineae bacterium]
MASLRKRHQWQPTVDQMWHWSQDGSKSTHNPAIISDDAWISSTPFGMTSSPVN